MASWGRKIRFDSKTEVYLKGINRRADVLLKNSFQKIVIEYQCSPITFQELAKRTQSYAKFNLKCIWIVGKRYRIQKRLSQKIAQFFKFHPNVGFYYLYLNVEL